MTIMTGQFLGEFKHGRLEIYSTKKIPGTLAFEHDTIGPCFLLTAGMNIRRATFFNADNDVEKFHDILLELKDQYDESTQS